MSTIIEDPGIPLVGPNGRFELYTHNNHVKPKRKYDNVGFRLARRKELFKRRKVICDFALGFAILGIALMIVETECYLNDVYTKDHIPSLLIKLCISVSTATLLGFVVWYHMLDIKLFMCDNSLEDWRLAMSAKRILRILAELLVYAIHPIPGHYVLYWKTYEQGIIPEVKAVPIDALLSIPMFLRFYLICRAIMLHSKLFTDASSQSLGALNRIHFNFKFIFKSMMLLYPEYVLCVLMLSVLITASWLLRACEAYHDELQSNFLNSMWLIAITFLSVGYGDIVPNSYCGRGIAVFTGIFGAGCTALVVAVLARKLELSRSEKYVHNFVIDVELDKRYKVAAANIVKAGWLVYRNKKLGKHAVMRRYQRKLLKAMHNLREIRHEQRRLMDSGVTLVEMYKSQNTFNTTLTNMDTKQLAIGERVSTMEEQLRIMDKKLDSIYNTLRTGVSKH